MLNVAEKPFVSLQGEGIQSGKPMLFVRLAGCNLRCKWCDTQYSWGKGFPMSEEELWTYAVKSGTRWICITGGEPLLQNLGPFFSQGLNWTRVEYSITLETNGTVAPKGNWFGWIDLLTISPKLTNSGMRDKVDFLVLEYLLTHRRCQLKFVCENTEDVLEAIGFVNELTDFVSKAKLLSTPIIIQPQGLVEHGGIDTYLQLYQHLWEYVAQNKLPWDVRVLPQLHRLIYGQRKGV